ncbi:unnamed protein product [Prorocentrum cordatum]|uniref:Uncharacterized protein n=1 Tax=Prorocentrum cordatum TaxID=2364126 RepID=A0ABN9TQU1_9DINO|nr:unnamed protein product [Polarella glacialis]
MFNITLKIIEAQGHYKRHSTQPEPKSKTVGTQSMYRESDAQTDGRGERSGAGAEGAKRNAQDRASLTAASRAQALEELRALVRGQQAQIAALSRRQAQLREESEALRECLEASGALAPVRFLASLHRRRFAEVIKRHPGPWPGSLDTVMQIRELALATAAHAGAASVTALAAASRALRGGVGSLLSEFPALFPSQVYAIGGADERSETLGTVERFDSRSCVWEAGPPLTEARESCASVASNGVLYVIGGVRSAGQCLASAGPEKSKWEAMPPMRNARGAAAAVASAGFIFVIGGRDGFQSLDSVERLDPCARRWELVQPLRSARFGAAAAVLNGFAYVVGGKGGGRVLDTAERLDLERGPWEQLPSLHARRNRAAAAAAHGRVYVAGGCDGSWQTGLRSVERFDPETWAWSILAPLQVPRWGAAAVPAGGSVCVLGGRNGGGALTAVERFDPATGTWEPLPPMPTARRFFGAAACRG